MFRQRSGAHDLKEYSPIFVQFIDCVWQIWRQYPWEFEFTDKLLLTLVYAVNSRFCEDFIYDNERQETHHKKVLKQVVRETCCSDCRKRREAFGSFQSQPPRGSETSSSDAPTWKTVGDVGTNSRLQHLGDDDEESEEECSMCGELFAQCGTSVWNHVAYNLDDYVNPLYCPTHLLSSDDGRKSCGLFSEPILCGGPYQTSQFHSNPGDNVASDADLGIHSHKSAHRSHLPHPSESSAFERLYGDFIPPVPPLGLDGELTPEGISLPRQLFVTASSSQKRLSLSAVDEKTPRDLSSSELLAESSEHPNPHMTPDASSKFAQSLSSAPSQDIHLLMPNFEVQHLALWEDAYFSGIPSLKSFGSSSSAFTRGIMASRIDIIKNQNRLVEQNELLEKKIDELSRQVKHLKEENELIATELSTFTHRIDHQSSSTSQFPDEAPSFNSDDFTVDDDFVVFKNVEKSDETDSMSRIISTGHLLEDYIPSSQR